MNRIMGSNGLFCDFGRNYFSFLSLSLYGDTILYQIRIQYTILLWSNSVVSNSIRKYLNSLLIALSWE